MQNNTTEKLVKSRLVTVNELKDELGEDYLTAFSLIKFLVKMGIAKECGKRPNAPGVRGKTSTEYEIPYEAELVFFTDEPEIVEVVPVEIAPVEVAPEVVQPVAIEPVVNNPVIEPVMA